VTDPGPPLPSATPEPPPEPATIRLFFDPLTSEGDRALVSGGVKYAVGYLEEATGLYGIDVSVYMYVLPQRLIAALGTTRLSAPVSIEVVAQRLQRTASEALPGVILIDPTSSLWVSQDDVNRFRVAAHEYFHVVQFELMGPKLTNSFYMTPIGTPRSEGPNWLFEGSAEYVSWKALEGADLANIDQYLSDNPPAKNVDLRVLETPLGYSTSELEGLLVPLHAVHLLTNDAGPESLVRFYQVLGEGKTWQEAFAIAFGRTVEAFYSEFRAYQGR
jgi:hypothetical protein